jgi:DNA repair exonuclease SbcCD ATPase subunit
MFPCCTGGGTFKKVVLGIAIGAVGLGTLVGFGEMWSYMRLGWNQARKAVSDSIPLEMKIKSARDRVENLLPELRKGVHAIAEAEATYDEMKKEVETRQAQLEKQKSEILALKNAIDGGNGPYQFAGRTYTSDEVKRDLTHRFERFKLLEETLASKRQILDARKKALDAAQAKFQQMLADKQTLEVDIEKLEADLAVLRSSEAASKINLDDTEIARTKELLAQIKKEINVKAKVAEAESKLTGEIPVSEEPSVNGDITQQIDDYFDKKTSPTSLEGKSL